MSLKKIKKPTCTPDEIHNACIDYLTHRDPTGDDMQDGLWFVFRNQYYKDELDKVELEASKRWFKGDSTLTSCEIAGTLFLAWLKGEDIKKHKLFPKKGKKK